MLLLIANSGANTAEDISQDIGQDSGQDSGESIGEKVMGGLTRLFSVRGWALEARLLRWMTLLWLSIGLVILFSASYPVAESAFDDGARYFKIQLVWALAGLLISRWVTRHPIQKILRMSGFFLLVCMLMVMATHIPGVGVSVNGATRWLPFGPFFTSAFRADEAFFGSA